MRKSVKIITGFLLTAILSAAAVFASFSDRLDVVNHISVGDVSISISEYARKGKGEVKYTQPSEVVPGQTISKIPRIKNNALPCWIRARITYAGENGKLERLKENAGAAAISLTAEEVAALDRALDEIPMSEVFGGTKIKK